MRVLVSTTAGSGHFGPAVPFARACQAAGHDVAVAAPVSFAGEVRAAGFDHLPFADAPPELMGPVFARLESMTFDDANDLVLHEVFGRLDARAALPGLVRIVDDWHPDLVLRDPAEFGSLAAARSAGVPHATVAIGVSAVLDHLVSAVPAPLAELDAVAGLPDGACAAAVRAAPTLTSVPALLDREAAPASVATGPVHRFRDESLVSRHSSLPGPWGDPSQPLVYVTFGSVAAALGAFAALYPAVLAAFADQPVRLLLTTGRGVDPAELTPVPTNARVERWWPQRDVLPAASVVVGHGGFGTTMGALAAGVPQVVVPLFAVDQRVNAEHVEAAGAGLHLRGGPAAVDVLPDAVARLLAEPTYRDAARTVAHAVADLPPVSAAVPTIERIATS